MSLIKCVLRPADISWMSRKSMIGALLSQQPDERLQGSVTAALLAVMKGAHIVRTHDVAQTRQALEFLQQMARCSAR